MRQIGFGTLSSHEIAKLSIQQKIDKKMIRKEHPWKLLLVICQTSMIICTQFFITGLYTSPIRECNCHYQDYGLKCYTTLIKVCHIGSYPLHIYKNLVALCNDSIILKNKQTNGINVWYHLILYWRLNLQPNNLI